MGRTWRGVGGVLVCLGLWFWFSYEQLWIFEDVVSDFAQVPGYFWEVLVCCGEDVDEASDCIVEGIVS